MISMSEIILVLFILYLCPYVSQLLRPAVSARGDLLTEIL
jgi:hypothetical protein